jgi:ABC-type bacteriocin/lantibiotic exporter with double-glycine peptidase domain
VKKTLLIRQRDSTDCGAACIASVCAHYNLKVRVSQVRLRAGTGKYGTSVFGLIQAATHFRFVAKAIRVPYGSLNEIPFPAIAHVQIHERFNHFMVIVRVTLNKIVLMDPAKGKLIRLSHNEFKKIWKGVAVVMIPGEEFINGKYVSNYRRFRQLARPHLTSMAFAFGIAVAMGMSGFFISLYVKKIVDTNWMPEKMTLLDSISVVSILVAVFHWSLEIARNLLTLKTGRDIDKNLVTAYYHHLLNLPQRFFDNMRVGEIIGRVNDAVKISNFINEVAGEHSFEYRHGGICLHDYVHILLETCVGHVCFNPCVCIAVLPE